MKLNQATAVAINGATSGIAEKLSVFDEMKDEIEKEFSYMPVDPR